MISSSPSSTDDLSGGPEDVCVRRRRDKGYDFSLLGLLYDLSSKGSARKNKTNQNNVDDPRAHQAIGPVVVILSPDFSRREWCICSQL
jgi:hypothetical protein